MNPDPLTQVPSPLSGGGKSSSSARSEALRGGHDTGRENGGEKNMLGDWMKNGG